LWTDRHRDRAKSRVDVLRTIALDSEPDIEHASTGRDVGGSLPQPIVDRSVVLGENALQEFGAAPVAHPGKVDRPIADRHVTPVDDSGDGSKSGVHQDVFGSEIVVNNGEARRCPGRRRVFQKCAPAAHRRTRRDLPHDVEPLECFSADLFEHRIISLIGHTQANGIVRRECVQPGEESSQ